jgi:hypothetical protein
MRHQRSSNAVVQANKVRVMRRLHDDGLTKHLTIEGIMTAPTTGGAPATLSITNSTVSTTIPGSGTDTSSKASTVSVTPAKPRPVNIGVAHAE